MDEIGEQFAAKDAEKNRSHRVNDDCARERFTLWPLGLKIRQTVAKHLPSFCNYRSHNQRLSPAFFFLLALIEVLLFDPH